MDWSNLLTSPLISVVGTLLGATVGSRLTTGRDRRRYSRELLNSVVDRRTTYRGDVCSALDFLIITYGNAGAAALGRRTPLTTERVDGAEERWREVLTRRYVFAEPTLQTQWWPSTRHAAPRCARSPSRTSPRSCSAASA